MVESSSSYDVPGRVVPKPTGPPRLVIEPEPPPMPNPFAASHVNAVPTGEYAERMDELLAAFRATRERTLALVAGLEPEDLQLQSMPDASPAKWHLAHTTWFFETFILAPMDPEHAPFEPAFEVLYNSYYNGVGEQYPRPRRGLVSRPRVETVLDYRAHVEERLARLATGAGADLRERIAERLVLGINHEEQHQELIVTDLLHAFSFNPLEPALRAAEGPPPRLERLRWAEFEGGEVRTGHAGEGFAFDNEGPAHAVLLRPFRLANRPISCKEWENFVEDGGYENPLLWLSDGWAWLQREQAEAPLYWRRKKSGVRSRGTGSEPKVSRLWRSFGLTGREPLRVDRPVTNLNYYEADAFARWLGKRLPTEHEWEHAVRTAGLGAAADRGGRHREGAARDPGARSDAPAGRNDRARATDAAGHAPARDGDRREAGSRDDGADGDNPLQLGHAWEWTASPYTPYPGFRPAEGAVGEYNGKFMVNQQVLRGASPATPPGHSRPGYRNFFPPHARWQFTTVRLAEDG